MAVSLAGRMALKGHQSANIALSMCFKWLSSTWQITGNVSKVDLMALARREDGLKRAPKCQYYTLPAVSHNIRNLVFASWNDEDKKGIIKWRWGWKGKTNEIFLLNSWAWNLRFPFFYSPGMLVDHSTVVMRENGLVQTKRERTRSLDIFHSLSKRHRMGSQRLEFSSLALSWILHLVAEELAIMVFVWFLVFFCPSTQDVIDM